MKISEVFTALATGELNNLSVHEEDTIKPEKLYTILSSLNFGLKDLYKRFLLKRGVFEITTTVNNPKYKITADNFIEVLKVQLNGCDLKDDRDYYLISRDEIFLNKAITTDEKLTVFYKAAHPKLTEEDINLDTELELPESHMQALLYFIASRLYASIPNQLDGDLNEGLRYTDLYLKEISTLIDVGIDVEHLEENTLFQQRGFV